MELSARNQLNGKITEINLGMITASIKIEVNDPNTITAVITKESAEKLGLKEGDDVKAIIKSTRLLLEKNNFPSIFLLFFSNSNGSST